MALKAKASSGGNGGNRTPQEIIPVGNYPARLVQVLDLGLQASDPKYGVKPPCQKISVTYELCTEFMKDEDGNELTDKPRWISEDFKLFPRSADRATSALRSKGIDPDNNCDDDWSQMLGLPCTVTVVHNTSKSTGKTYANVGNVTPPMRGFPVPELVNEARIFLLDEPNLEMFTSLPEFLQERIKSNLEYNGSQLQAMLGEAPTKEASADTPAPSEEAAPVIDDMSCPF